MTSTPRRGSPAIVRAAPPRSRGAARGISATASPRRGAARGTPARARAPCGRSARLLVDGLGLLDLPARSAERQRRQVLAGQEGRDVGRREAKRPILGDLHRSQYRRRGDDYVDAWGRPRTTIPCSSSTRSARRATVRRVRQYGGERTNAPLVGTGPAKAKAKAFSYERSTPPRVEGFEASRSTSASQRSRAPACRSFSVSSYETSTAWRPRSPASRRSACSATSTSARSWRPASQWAATATVKIARSAAFAGHEQPRCVESSARSRDRLPLAGQPQGAQSPTLAHRRGG